MMTADNRGTITDSSTYQQNYYYLGNQCLHIYNLQQYRYNFIVKREIGF
jgi:hypothetical protein